MDRPVAINTNRTAAILAMLLFCLPFGIVSLVYAAKANGRAQAGDRAGAQVMACRSRMWFWISLGVALGWIVLFVLYCIFYAARETLPLPAP